MEQGPESQSASQFCSGGVSAVISASDLDDHTLHPDRRTAYPLSCSLPSGRNPTTLRPACRGATGPQPPQLTVRPDPLVAEAMEECFAMQLRNAPTRCLNPEPAARGAADLHPRPLLHAQERQILSPVDWTPQRDPGFLQERRDAARMGDCRWGHHRSSPHACGSAAPAHRSHPGSGHTHPYRTRSYDQGSERLR